MPRSANSLLVAKVSAAVAVLTVGAAVGATSLAVVWVVGVIGLAAFLVAWRHLHLPSAIVLFGTVVGSMGAIPTGSSWHLGVVVGAVAALGLAPVATRDAMRKLFRRPRITPLLLVVAAICTSVASLFVWWDISQRGGLYFLPTTSVTVLLSAALGNALAEELVWRAAAVSLLLSQGWSLRTVVLLTSLSFGLSHVAEGVPSGLAAIPAAGAYGVVMCVLFITTRSLWLPLASHVCVDVTIVAGLAGWVP